MNVESLKLLLLLFAPILGVFLLEALVMFFFRFRSFWFCFAVSILLNLFSLLLIYLLASPILASLGYDTAQFNGLNTQPPVMAFLWWFSVMIDGLLLQLFTPRKEKQNLYPMAVLMNLLSFLFLYVFVEFSH